MLPLELASTFAAIGLAACVAAVWPKRPAWPLLLAAAGYAVMALL